MAAIFLKHWPLVSGKLFGVFLNSKLRSFLLLQSSCSLKIQPLLESKTQQKVILANKASPCMLALEFDENTS